MGLSSRAEALNPRGRQHKVCILRVLIDFLKPCFTFPQASDTLLPGDGPVGLQRAAVPLHCGALRQTALSLEPDFDHISGLGKGHGHGSRGAACQQPGPDADTCGEDDRRRMSLGGGDSD